MNTKQILYNALSAQLAIKKIEAEKYTNEVYKTAKAELKDNVLEYFTNRIKDFNVLNFTGNNIRLELGSSYYDRVEISVNNSWRNDEKVDDVKLEWNSGNITNKKDGDTGYNYLNLLNKVYSNFGDITDKYLNKWWPTYLSIERGNTDAWKEHNELKDALNKLNNEIRNDSTEAMKQIGFEIKKFKIETSLDWDYTNDKRKYKILTRNKSISLQRGRSMHDTINVIGFKVLGKKGNKYNVEVYKDEIDSSIICNVLEKKFDSFIENVSRWENGEADKRSEKIKQEFEERTENNF